MSYQDGQKIKHIQSGEVGTIKEQLKRCVLDHDCSENDGDDCEIKPMGLYLIEYSFGESINMGQALQPIECEE